MEHGVNPSPADSGIGTDRRKLCTALGGLGAAVVLGAPAGSGAAGEEGAGNLKPLPLVNGGPDRIPQRRLGRHAETISILGVGGHHLGDLPGVDEAVSLIHEALDSGATFFDNCWEYYNGKTEEWLGRGLKGRRDRAFVMTKVCTHGRSADLGMKMLEESLRRLQTDHLDLWQIHAISYDNDPELAYAKGGIIEALEKAKRQGKTRYVGFTGHRDPSFHLRMIEMGFPWDTVQQPLNPFDASFFSFQRQVVPEALRRGIAVLGMKPMGGTGEAIRKGVATPEELLRYALSLPASVTISGMASLEHLRGNVKVARDFQPMSEGELRALEQRCAQTAADGRFEPSKVSLRYDNPITRTTHGYPSDPQQREVKEMNERQIGLPGTAGVMR